jgi:hypothetical protein
MVEAQTPSLGDGMCKSGDHEREPLAPFYHCLMPGGVAFSYLVIMKSLTHTFPCISFPFALAFHTFLLTVSPDNMFRQIPTLLSLGQSGA